MTRLDRFEELGGLDPEATTYPDIFTDAKEISNMAEMLGRVVKRVGNFTAYWPEESVKP